MVPRQDVVALTKKASERCAKPQHNKEQCYARELEKVAFAYGRDDAIAVLNSLRANYATEYECHFIAHGIGWGLYKRDPARWREQALADSGDCNYGIFHGIMEYYAAELPKEERLTDNIISICGQKPTADCLHSIGHVLMVMENGDTNKALTDCDSYVDGLQRSRCYSGVFMEVLTGYMLVEHKLAPQSYLDWDAKMGEFGSICRSYSLDRAAMCWQEIIHPAIVVFEYDAKKVISFCKNAPFHQAQENCIGHAIGILTVHRNFNLEEARDVCAVFPQDRDFIRRCYITLVGTQLEEGIEYRHKSVEFCNSIEAQYQSDCFGVINTFL